MKTFSTLRGFLKGEEPDEPPYFAYCASLWIFGDDLDFDEITKQLGVTPSSTRRKGEKPGPRSPGTPHDSWRYEASLDESLPLATHIDALWADIRHARESLVSLKAVATVDVFLGYRSNIDMAGLEVPHTSLEMFTSLEIPFGVSIIIT